jgi:hypothetical protein
MEYSLTCTNYFYWTKTPNAMSLPSFIAINMVFLEKSVTYKASLICYAVEYKDFFFNEEMLIRKWWHICYFFPITKF